MILLDQIKNYFDSLEVKTFYNYMLGYLIACVLLFGVSIFYFYSSTSSLQRKIKNINSTREDEVRVILETAAHVKQQQTIVEEILSKDIDFKIVGYFEDLLNKLGIKDKKVSSEATTTDREDNYRKSELSAKFEDMTMKDLTELLQELEQKPRIATERLEITKKKPNQKTIEVNLTISTLLPKAEASA
jgi:hypothetical protein